MSLSVAKHVGLSTTREERHANRHKSTLPLSTPGQLYQRIQLADISGGLSVIADNLARKKEVYEYMNKSMLSCN